jgi:hypothetical protein
MDVTLDAWKWSFGCPLAKPLIETRDTAGCRAAEPKARQPLTPTAAFTGSVAPLWAANCPPTVCGPEQRVLPTVSIEPDPPLRLSSTPASGTSGIPENVTCSAFPLTDAVPGIVIPSGGGNTTSSEGDEPGFAINTSLPATGEASSGVVVVAVPTDGQLEMLPAVQADDSAACRGASPGGRRSETLLVGESPVACVSKALNPTPLSLGSMLAENAICGW